MVKQLFAFAAAALATFTLCAPGVALATRRVGPGVDCLAVSPSSLSFAFNCNVPSGTEFPTSTIVAANVDYFTAGATAKLTSVQTCRQEWTSSTLTCSAVVSATTQGLHELSPSTTTFSSGSEYDFRFYHIETNGATMVGTLTANTGF